MRNRRNVLIAFLLCACLIVGVGYAALSTDLYLNGSADLSAEHMEEVFDSQIKWISAVSEDPNQVSATISDEGDKITLNANNLLNVGDIIEVVCEMKNESEDLAATVIEPTLEIVEKAPGDADYFEVSLGKLSSTELGPKQTATVLVQFKLKQSFVPTAAKDLVQVDFNLTYTVKTVS